MKNYALNMRVSHPRFGQGTVEGISNGQIVVRFDRDKKVRCFSANSESFIAEQQKKIEEKW